MMLLTELGNSISYNEKEAEEAVKISNLASSTLVVGAQKMKELRAAMREINQCSEQIIAVISAISDIGEEIDLLSLNASIESARAGEAGRGFAVVAEQVKKLAEASQSAVGQTSELIKRTVESVEVGTRISREAAANMEEVQMGAEETTGRINGIVDKLKLEVESIGHINESIGVVAGIVGTDGKRPLTQLGGVHVEGGGFHLYRQHAHFPPLHRGAGRIVEGVRGQHVAYRHFHTHLSGSGYGSL